MGGGQGAGVDRSLWPSFADNQGFLKRRIEGTNASFGGDEDESAVTSKDFLQPLKHARRGNQTTAKHEVDTTFYE